MLRIEHLLIIWQWLLIWMVNISRTILFLLRFRPQLPVFQNHHCEILWGFCLLFFLHVVLFLRIFEIGMHAKAIDEIRSHSELYSVDTIVFALCVWIPFLVCKASLLLDDKWSDLCYGGAGTPFTPCLMLIRYHSTTPDLEYPIAPVAVPERKTCCWLKYLMLRT